MSVVDIDDSWSSLLKSVWIEALDSTPLLAGCRSGSVRRADLTAFVAQHHHYSRHFTRYLSALLSNIGDEDDRGALVQNLFEEMGMSQPSSIPHAKLYREMMRTLGIDPRMHPAYPETEELTRTMLACCRSERPMMGLGALCLGAEAIVPRMYSTILEGFGAVGERPENLAFFYMHVAEDDAHAGTMKAIIDRELARRPESRVDLDYGAARAILARVNFFRAITERSSGAGARIQEQVS
jgi:pyrroloquinoline quinone (PQQ) biosynthesis protein C